MAECENYVRIDGSHCSLMALQLLHFDPLTWFPQPIDEKSKLTYMLREFGCRWITDDADKLVLLHRHLTYLDATFNTDCLPPLPFYRKLVARFPDIRITYEYFHWQYGIVGHGHITAANAHRTLPIAYAFKSLGELASIRSTRLWRLPLAEPGQLPPAPWEHEFVDPTTLRVTVTFEPDDEGDWIMV